MGRATLVNGFVATGAGVISNQLVSRTGNFVSPFVASGVLLMLAFVVIRASWAENYGGNSVGGDQDPFQLTRLSKSWAIVRSGWYLVSEFYGMLTRFPFQTHSSWF
jgi:hypothetical protein